MVQSAQTVNAGFGAVTHTTGYGYDAAGRVASITYPSGRVVRYARSGGQLSAVSLAADAAAAPQTLLSGIQSDPAPGEQGAIRSWLWQLNGRTQAHERVFDTYGRMVRYPLGGAVRDVLYDAADRITGYRHLDAATGSATPAAQALDQSFGYDELGRLTSVGTSVGQWALAYDANGNRTSANLTTAQGTQTRQYQVAAASNRVTGLDNPGRSIYHDSAGNTTADYSGGLAWDAGYDASNRLWALSIYRSTPPYTVDVTYGHNVAAQRVFKVVYNYPSVAKLVFVYDLEGRLLGEYDAANGDVRREYVWLQGMPVAFVDGPPAAPLIYYVYTDHLDAPRVVIDQAGNQRWSWVAEPFGNSAPVTSPTGLAAVELNLRFPGQYFDAETGLSYNWHRDYDASLGRYTQSDPIGLAGGINTYAYSENNPVSFSDPKGLVTWKGWAKSISLGPYQREEYVLTSDCLCGAKWKIKVTVNYGGPGKGPGIAQQWYARLSDPLACPSPSALAGPAYSFSAGLAARYGFIYSRTRLGLAESEGWDVVEGLGAAVGVGTGISSVEVLERTPCDDCPPK